MFVKTNKMENLHIQFRKLLSNTTIDFTRGLINEINWKARLIGIKGARGSGKTTLMLQYIKLYLEKELASTLYVSLDHLYFSSKNLVDFTDEFVQYGGKYLFLDEVHKYPNWSQEIKNIYDSYPDLKIVFTGSSLLEILNARADLSRRAVVYFLQGLSFREYLNLETGKNFPTFTLKDILGNHIDISNSISSQVRPLVHFKEYLETGYYPFYKEELDLYAIRLREITNMVLEIELPLLRQIDVAYISRIKQLLYIIINSVPFVPNVSKLAEKINIQRGTLLHYIHVLDEVKLTKNLFKSAHGISQLQKPQKIYLDNTNLMFALGQQKPDMGNMRETFFANQIGYRHQLTYPNVGDFMVDENYLFEIGGKNKTKKQLKNQTKSFIAADDMEIGFQNKIPLWLFGLLY